jgi:hypothetical protein
MKTKRPLFPMLLMVCCLLLVLSANHALALAIEWDYSATDKIEVKGHDGLPTTAVLEALNFPGRVYGFHNESLGWMGMGGTWDTIYWRGTTKDVNRFLEMYAIATIKPLTVVIHIGQPTFSPKSDNRLIEVPGANKTPAPDRHYDWSLVYHLAEAGERLQPVPDETISVDVWIGGGVQLDELKVPANITVQNGGELEKFIERHKSSQTP